MITARRAHPKSRSGCTECKRRRVKCDEGRPDCSNCRKRSVTCSFYMFDPARRTAVLSPSANETMSPQVYVFSQKPEDSPRSVTHSGLLSDQVQDDLLKDFPSSSWTYYKSILHHFALHVIPTLSCGYAAQAAWHEALPGLATSRSFVTRGMLAIASLDLARLAVTEETRQAYQDTAATQMNDGMAQYRAEVQHVTTENAEALFAFSTSITVFVFSTSGAECEAVLKPLLAGPTTNKTNNASVPGLVNTVCRMFEYCRGIQIILVPCWDHILSGSLQPVVQRDWWPLPIPVTSDEIREDRKLHELEKLWCRIGRTYEYYFDTLRQELKSLRETFAITSRLMSLAQAGDPATGTLFDWTSVLHWPAALSTGFLSLLEARQTEAWVIIAHYAILPARVKHIIWLDGFATNVVATAALVIGTENWKWIEWPAATVGVDLERLRDLAVAPTEAKI